jgi:hypothetical protein
MSVSVSDSSVDRAFRILYRAFDLALRSSLSLEPLVTGQVAYRLLHLAFEDTDFFVSFLLSPIPHLHSAFHSEIRITLE